MILRVPIRALSFGLFIASCQPSVSPPRHAATSLKPGSVQREMSPAGRLQRANARLELSAYPEAEAEFRALLATALGAEATLGLGQLLVKTGRYSQALNALTPLLSEPSVAARAAVWSARAQRNLGNLAAAERILRGVEGNTSTRGVRLELAEILLDEGRRVDAEPVLMTLVTDYNDDLIKDSDGADLALVGRAAQLLRSPRDANNAFNAAERVLAGDTRTLRFRA